jgi:hypothetical protein
MRRSITLFVAVGAVLFLWAASPAAAKTWEVEPGESIQAAVDAAKPGDTIRIDNGIYRQNVTITTDELTIVGAGGGPHGTVLKPAATPTPSPCTSPGEGGAGPIVNGICVVGELDPQTFEPGDPVKDVEIRGIVTEGFSGFGIFAFNADEFEVTRSIARRNEGYGISGFLLSDVELKWNIAHGNGEPGFYIGDSPHADAEVVGNRAYNNIPDGFLFRDASHGVVRKNVARENCVGMTFVNTGEPGPVADWSVRRNLVTNNTDACPGGDGPPPLSGIGILLQGTTDTVVSRNRVTRNAPSGFSAVPSGGVVLVSGAPAGGSVERDNVIRNNVALNNSPVDIFWDGAGTGNRFPDNRCGTSDPGWICAD